MIQLLELIMILENSRFVRWVTLNAYKIFLGCFFFNLFFNTVELVEVINIKTGEMKLNSNEEMIELNWLKIIIEYYWMSLIFFGLMYFGIRARRKKERIRVRQIPVEKYSHLTSHQRVDMIILISR